MTTKSEIFILPALIKNREGLEGKEIQKKIDEIMGSETPWGKNPIIFQGELIALEGEGKITKVGNTYEITEKGRTVCKKNKFSVFFSQYSCH